MQLVPGLGKCGAAGMRRLPPLVLWFEVCIFPLSRARWAARCGRRTGSAAAMTAS